MNLPVRNQNFLDEAISLFNQPALHMFEVIRVIGYGETGFDNYWIVNTPNPSKTVWVSFVCGPIPLTLLKEQDKLISSSGEVWNDYTRIDNWLELNGCQKEEKFLLVIEHDNMELDFGNPVGNEITGDYANE